MPHENPGPRPTRSAATPDRERLADWLIARVADYLRLDPADIDASVPLPEYGLDSLHAVALCGEIEDEFELVVDPTLLWDNPSIEALSGALDSELSAR